jgi:hypothetical protein
MLPIPRRLRLALKLLGMWFLVVVLVILANPEVDFVYRAF